MEGALRQIERQEVSTRSALTLRHHQSSQTFLGLGGDSRGTHTQEQVFSAGASVWLSQH